jgi:hypothetical protein
VLSRPAPAVTRGYLWLATPSVLLLVRHFSNIRLSGAFRASEFDFNVLLPMLRIVLAPMLSGSLRLMVSRILLFVAPRIPCVVALDQLFVEAGIL